MRFDLDDYGKFIANTDEVVWPALASNKTTFVLEKGKAHTVIIDRAAMNHNDKYGFPRNKSTLRVIKNLPTWCPKNSGGWHKLHFFYNASWQRCCRCVNCKLFVNLDSRKKRKKNVKFRLTALHTISKQQSLFELPEFDI